MKKAPKPRNPFVQHIVRRKGGAHAKPYKVERQQTKISLRKQAVS